MKQFELSKWLKGLVIITGTLVLIILLFLVPSIGKSAVELNPELDYMYYPCLIFILITAVPFYLGLWKSWGICCEIAKDNSFSEKNAISLKFIGNLALLDGFLYFIGLIVLLLLKVLHPGIFIVLLFIIFFTIALAVVFASLSHLVKKASDLKQENDYTI